MKFLFLICCCFSFYAVTAQKENNTRIEGTRSLYADQLKVYTDHVSDYQDKNNQPLYGNHSMKCDLNSITSSKSGSSQNELANVLSDIIHNYFITTPNINCREDKEENDTAAILNHFEKLLFAKQQVYRILLNENFHGKELMQLLFTKTAGKAYMNIEGIPEGVYLITWKDNSGNYYRQKVIIFHP